MRYFSALILLYVVLVGTSSAGVFIKDKTIEVVVDGSTTPYTDPAGPNDWYGRNMIAVVDENRWLMALRSGMNHIEWNSLGDTIHLMTSNDEGRTWSGLNQWFDGTAISGLPTPYDWQDHSEPGLYRMPNGDFILQYWRTWNTTGTKQLRSADNGKTWVTDIDRINVAGVPGAAGDRVIGTEDYFVDPENPSDVYMAFQYYQYDNKVGNLLAKSQDNGHSYSFLSWITPLVDETSPQAAIEPSIEYVGNRTIVSVIRGYNDSLGNTWQAVSTDMGASFGPQFDISDQIDGGVEGGLWHRPRIYKESNPYFQHNNSLDYAAGEGLLWGFGMHSNGGGYTRKPAVYWSDDNGTTWNGPELLHGPISPGTDTGYGDLKRRTDGTFVADTYYANSDSTSADVEQYTFKTVQAVTLALVDNGSPGPGLHSYTLTATGPGITTLSKFTIDGEVHQVFNAGVPSEWLGDGSASWEPTDSFVIFGDLRLPDLGGGTWPGPGDPPSQITEETITGGGDSGMGTLNNYDESVIPVWDAYVKFGTPSTVDETVPLMQLVVVDGGGTSGVLTLLVSTNYDPVTGQSTVFSFDLPWLLAALTAGDANGDGAVDSTDASIVAQHWQQLVGAAWADGDFNGDGAVNDLDATMLAANWNPQAASVPEPTTFCMLLSVFCMLLILYRKE